LLGANYGLLKLYYRLVAPNNNATPNNQ